MRVTTLLFAAAGTLAGVTGAVVVYDAVVPDQRPVASPVTGPTATPTETVVHLLPCEPGWKLRDGVCVRVLERRVIVPVPVTPYSARVQSGAAAEDRSGKGGGSASGGSDAQADHEDRDDEHEDRDEAEDRDDDHGDDHEDRDDEEDRSGHGDGHEDEDGEDD